MEYLGGLVVERTFHGHNVVLQRKAFGVLRQVIQICHIARMNREMWSIRLVVAVVVAVYGLFTDHRLQVLLPVRKRRQGVGSRCEEPHSHGSGGLQESRNHTSEHEIEYDGK